MLNYFYFEENCMEKSLRIFSSLMTVAPDCNPLIISYKTMAYIQEDLRVALDFCLKGIVVL